MNEEVQAAEEESNSLMDDLAAAWDASEDTDDADQSATPISDNSTDQGAAGDGSQDDGQPAGDAPAVSGDANAPAEGQAAAQPELGESAPVGLPPAAREAWGETPQAMREAIAKREQDYAKGIQQYAEGAKRAEGMDRALAPHQQFLQVNGGPQQAIHGLLQVGSALQFGNPQQKAQTAANLIKQFGVDIKALDNFLVGQGAPRQMQEDSKLQELLDQRLGPLQQQLQQYQQRDQQAEQQQQQKISADLEQFSQTNEFYNDVKLDMADIMDFAARRDQEMSLQEAYDRACQLRPDIKAIVDARGTMNGTQAKRRAAVSVSGGPGGPGGHMEPDSTRAALEAAWDEAGRV